MKAKLIFDVPEERKQFFAAVKADDMASALWDIVFNHRGEALRLYADGPKKFTAEEIVNGIYDTISDMLDSHGIMIDDLTE